VTTATPGPEEAPAPKRVLAYVPEGYELRRRGATPARRTPPPPRPRGALLLGITATLVLGIVVGYLTGFAVARRESSSVVDVTVHPTTTAAR